MAELLKPDQKVKYTHEGKTHTGIIHGVKTHETTDGQVTRIAYLIDTGNSVHRSKIFRQPEQVEVDQTEVRLP